MTHQRESPSYQGAGRRPAMLLNRVESMLMNNPLRAALQRHYEARRLLRMGGAMGGGHALELGCGRGVGCELILDVFGAGAVDAFDIDPRMVLRARRRLGRRRAPIRLWVGDARAISAPDDCYDAVFDFGIIHHVPDWRPVVQEVHRVLKPGGRFYSEEILRRLILHPVTRGLLEHPLEDRFDAADFGRELTRSGFERVTIEDVWGAMAWFTACKTSGPARHGASSRGCEA